MRRIDRVALQARSQAYLDRRQLDANEKSRTGLLNIDTHWKSSRQTGALKTVLATLQGMMGPTQRCMYCLDSHGADIEHFKPKALYPKYIYQWSNLLLCCTECGRFKGTRFPITKKGVPLLVDPTRENPWKHLDFDPVTGNISARFDLRLNDWSPKGVKTVETLQLDRREALAAMYMKTLRRLSAIVHQALQNGAPQAQELVKALQDGDDHGLLEWCLSDRGRTLSPFSHLHQQYPQVWRQCARLL